VGSDIFNWSTSARFILVAELGLRRLNHLDPQQTVSHGWFDCHCELPGSVLSRLTERVPVCIRLAEVRLYCGIGLDHRVPSDRHSLHALHRWHDSLSWVRVPKHGPQPHLRLHFHILQYLLPPKVLSISLGLDHILQFILEFPYPCPCQMVWR